jgi:Rod binding domain-containing protein
MTQGMGGDDLLGDGQDDVFRDMLNEEIAKLISRSGGIGVADAVLREMLKAQEVA